MRKAWSVKGLTIVWAVVVLAAYQALTRSGATADWPEWLPIAGLVALWVAGGIYLQLRELGRFGRMARELGLERIEEAESHEGLSPRAHHGRYRGRMAMLDLRIPQRSGYPRSRFFVQAPEGLDHRIVLQRRGGPGTGGRDLPPAVDPGAHRLAEGWDMYCQDPDLARAAITPGLTEALGHAGQLVEIDSIDGWLRGEVHDRVLDPAVARRHLDAVVALARGLERAVSAR